MAKEEKKERIFISYSRKDNEDDFVGKLYTALRKQGFDVWWDNELMESNTQLYRQQIREAIWEIDRIIAVISPDALKSDPVWHEWEHGCLYSKSFIPILRRGEYKKILQKLVELNCPDFFEKHPSELLPEYILSLHCLDFRRDKKRDLPKRALSKLLKSLKTPVIMGELSVNIRKPPACFVPRPEVLRKMFDVMFADVLHDVIIRGGAKITAIHGRGGAGKSVMAWSFAQSLITRRGFKDGIIWLQIGQRADVLSAVKYLGEFFEEEILEQADDLEKAKTPLTEILKDKSCLIILDDVWQIDPVAYFSEVLGERCRMLCTTRDENCIKDLNGNLVPLGKLEEGQAKRLMANWTKVEIDELPPEALELARECDMLAIAVALCGALVNSGDRRWSQLIKEIKKAKTNLVRRFPYYSAEEINFFSPFQVSLDYLKELDRLEQEKPPDKQVAFKRYDRYLEMVVFGSEIYTPEKVISEFWEKETKLDEGDARSLIADLIRKSLLRTKKKAAPPEREVSLHNLQQVYLKKIVGKEEVATLHKHVGNALLEWWKSNSKKESKETEELQACNYIIDHLYEHFVAGEDYNGLAELLSNIEYLSCKQEKSIQYRFQDEITSLLTKEPKDTTPEKEDELIQELKDILLSVLEAIKTMPLSKEKADWLDTFAYWLMEYGFKKVSDKRANMLKAMSNEYDRTCAVVSEELAVEYESSGEYDYSVRFAELYTWVCQRAEDFEECLKACKFAEELCRKEGVPEAYRSLGAAEFIRMRASVHKALAETIDHDENIDLAKGAYDTFVKELFSEIWMPSIDEWESIEGGGGDVLVPPLPNVGPGRSKFKARVVSNTHDCIAAIHVIRFFLKHQGQVEWIHHKEITLDQLSSDDVLFTVLIGGPKAPERSEVAYEFYVYEEKQKKPEDKDYQSKYLQMYSGMHIKAFRLAMQKGNTHCYMLGGISKLNTLMAAYEFTEHALEAYPILKTAK